MLASASKFIDIEAKEAEAEADDLEYSDTDVGMSYGFVVKFG